MMLNFWSGPHILLWENKENLRGKQDVLRISEDFFYSEKVSQCIKNTYKSMPDRL